MAQSVLLYDRESWVVTGEILKILTGFHHWVAQQITGITAIFWAGEEWEYQLIEEAMEAVGIHPIWVYINRRQTTIAERLACSPA